MRLLLLLTFFPAFLHAQSAFLKNPDIVWAAELEQDWIVDVPSLETEWEAGITTLKLLRTERNANNWSNPYLANLVYAAIVVSVEPEPFRDIRAWRLRQILSYHRKTASWSTTVEAIAPLIIVKDQSGDSVGTRTLCWFRPDDKRQKLKDHDIVWAKKMANRQPATHIPTVPENPVKMLEGFQNPFTDLLKVLETNLKMPFFNSRNEQLLTPADRARLLAQTDTILTFNPETYEELVKVVHNELNIDDLRALRLIQTWYWDERHHRLSICLDAVAPLRNVLDGEGNLRFQVPLFYQRIR